MGVEPWERDVLAKEEMQLVIDPVEAGMLATLAMLKGADAETFLDNQAARYWSLR